MHAADRIRGFTLIELIAVLIIAGILAAIVLVRAPGASFGVRPQAEQLAADLRYAQTLEFGRSGALRQRWLRFVRAALRRTADLRSAARRLKPAPRKLLGTTELEITKFMMR